MGGKGSGRTPINAVQAAYNRLDPKLPLLFEALIDRATASGKCPHCGEVIPGICADREAAIYLIDRRLGRPRQEIDQRTRVEISLSPSDYAALARARTIEAQLAGVRLLDPGTAVDAEVIPHTEDVPDTEALEPDGTEPNSEENRI